VLAVSGPPASGKSTLAQALGRRSGLPVLSSDALRKRRLGIAPDAPAPASAYAGDARAAIYHELGELAARRQAVIVDATFGDSRLRSAFLAGLGDVPGLRAIECEAPAGVRDRWARRRTPADASASDATPGVAARLGAAYRGWEELDEDAILPVRCGGAAEHLVDQVADWLDAPAIAAVTA
jgi:predicted kinase